MDLTSNSSNIQHTSQLIMDAFRHYGTQAGGVISYEELLAYLDNQPNEHQHYNDTLKEAEFHLSKIAYATPDPGGLRLTDVGFGILKQGNPIS